MKCRRLWFRGGLPAQASGVCGSGGVTEYQRKKAATKAGLDFRSRCSRRSKTQCLISGAACRRWRRAWPSPACAADVHGRGIMVSRCNQFLRELLARSEAGIDLERLHQVDDRGAPFQLFAGGGGGLVDNGRDVDGLRPAMPRTMRLPTIRRSIPCLRRCAACAGVLALWRCAGAKIAPKIFPKILIACSL